MAFKATDSFLRFLTMGAMATHKARSLLQAIGYQVIELERYAGCNKIWQTKVKRLRMPDLLCVRTGVRFEVRAKSDLEIKMSHSPANEGRHWDAGLRDNDVVIFMKVHEESGNIRIADTLNAFRVNTMRASQATARLGPPKSSTEGAERDLTWPSWVPARAGRVEATLPATDGTIRSVRVLYDDGGAYTYSRMAGKHLYIPIGGRFSSNDAFLMGTPPSMAGLDAMEPIWSPIQDLRSQNAGERYAAVKACYRIDINCVRDELIHMLHNDGEDKRVRLEVAGVLASHGVDVGLHFLADCSLSKNEEPEWLMESVFILTDLAGSSDAVDALSSAANQSPHTEARAAAAWGMGRIPGSLPKLLPLLSDADDNVAIHAVMAACALVDSAKATNSLLELLQCNPRGAAAASEVLARSPRVELSCLLQAVSQPEESPKRNWSFAALARRSPHDVRCHKGWHEVPAPIRKTLEAAWFGGERSWMASAPISLSLSSLSDQSLDLVSGWRPV